MHCCVYYVKSVPKMQLVLSISFFVLLAIYEVLCVQLTHSYREDIAQMTTIIKSEVSTLLIVVIFVVYVR